MTIAATAAEHLLFEVQPRPPGRKTDVVSVRASGNRHLLGEIRWFAQWRQYVLAAMEGTVWSQDCLDRAAAEIRRMMEARRQ